ncbi:MAG: multidrug effflux MFS transporter [Alphaproteobacteria bacterium]|nr:multidrug effflux MFS transporter [Alphaproteobacteria bacterium]
MSAPQPVRPSFAILVAISAVGPLALNIFMPSMPGLQREFGVPYGTVQLTLTLYLIGMAACQLIYGPISDRVGRRPMLLGGLAVFLAASLMAAMAPSIEWLILARLLQALGGAAGIVLARAMVRDVFDREQSASVISYITMAFVVAPMVAPAIGGLIDAHGGWRASFWLLTVLGAAVLLAATLRLPETHVTRLSGGSATGLISGAVNLFALPRFRAYAITLSFTSAVFFSFLGGAPHIMVDVLGYTPVEYGLWFAVVSVGYMTGNFLSGRFTQRVGLDRMILYGCSITLAGGALCFAAAVSGMLSPLTLFAPMALAALGNGLTIPNGTAGAISVDPRLTGAAAGWSGFAQMACGAAASQLVGSLQTNWPFVVFWFMAVASLLALASHVLSIRQPRNFTAGQT